MSWVKHLQWLMMAFMVFPQSLWANNAEFPRPKELEPNVRFWTRIYSEWRTNQIVLFDTEHLDMIYRVLEFPDAGDEAAVFRYSNAIEKAKKELGLILKDLDRLNPKSADGLTGYHKDIFLALKDINRPDKYQRGHLIRAMNGLRERFERGVFLSGAYDDEMKALLKNEGMPEELLGVVFVESMFNPGSRSKVGASGLWQFMPGTAKEYMCVNRLVDERFDPIIATKAAIKYLKKAKERFGKWPLAITSYNYGPAGVARAVRMTGTDDFAEISKRYEHPRFGFASRNYYPEFLAAVDVYKKRDHYFKDIKRRPHWDFDIAQLPHPVYLNDLVAVSAISRDFCLEHNPALSDRVRQGLDVLPADFTLRIPIGSKKAFLERAQKINQRQILNAKNLVVTKHKATGRQSISQIAKLYGVFHNSIAERLGFEATARPKKGTVILVKSADSIFSAVPPPLYRPAETLSLEERGQGEGEESAIATKENLN